MIFLIFDLKTIDLAAFTSAAFAFLLSALPQRFSFWIITETDLQKKTNLAKSKILNRLVDSHKAVMEASMFKGIGKSSKSGSDKYLSDYAEKCLSLSILASKLENHNLEGHQIHHFLLVAFIISMIGGFLSFFPSLRLEIFILMTTLLFCEFILIFRLRYIQKVLDKYDEPF